MKSFFCLDFIVCLVVLIVALAGFSEADGVLRYRYPYSELEQNKNRRGGGAPSGLIAFPRVGRSDPNMANNVHEADAGVFEGLYSASLEDYDDFPKNDIKRASLIAFPRVGRNDAEVRKWARLLALQQALDKRTGPSATSGLWFGPRLGKRSIEGNEHKQAPKTAPKEVY